jgi:hypothetical protein
MDDAVQKVDLSSGELNIWKQTQVGIRIKRGCLNFLDSLLFFIRKLVIALYQYFSMPPCPGVYSISPPQISGFQSVQMRRFSAYTFLVEYHPAQSVCRCQNFPASQSVRWCLQLHNGLHWVCVQPR